MVQLRADAQKRKGQTMPRNALNCNKFVSTSYEVYCYYQTQEDEENMHATCMFYSVTEYINICSGGGNNGGGNPPGSGGGGGDDYPPVDSDPYPKGPIEPLEDPCAEAKAGAEKATNLSKNTKFSSAKTDIKNLAADGKEHAVSFGKTNGQVTRSKASTGTGHSAPVPNIAGKYADLHSHTNNSPPSSGDLYGFIDNIKTNSSYETRYIVNASGTVYALSVVNKQAAIDFNTNYPRQPAIGGNEPRFPQDIVNEIIEMIQRDNATEEMALAYILEKYNAGVALLKQNAAGDFKRLNTKLEGPDANGNNVYSHDNCP